MMPSTGRRVVSRAECRPGSLKHAMTKAAARGSSSAISRSIGATTPSTSRWVWMPDGPSASVTHSMRGAPAMRSGSHARSMPRVTASVEFGLMTKIVSPMAGIMRELSGGGGDRTLHPCRCGEE
jgi:hypothetical protein